MKSANIIQIQTVILIILHVLEVSAGLNQKSLHLNLTNTKHKMIEMPDAS